MGLFDRKKEATSFPEPPRDEPSAFPEPPKTTEEDLGSVKNQVEEAPMSLEEEPSIEGSDLIDEELEDVDEELMESPEEPIIPEPIMSTTISPTLYLKLTEYKEVVEATNKMRKDIEKAKQIVSELRNIEKEEHSKLEKS